MRKSLFAGILITSTLLQGCKNTTTMNYETKTLSQFYVIGISIRTTNQNDQSQKDIGDLWGKYMSEGIASEIPNKESEDTYCVYTDYESDANGKYSTVLGCKVKSLDSIPTGMVGITVPQSSYRVYTSTGKLPDCVVATWMDIWKMDIKRKYAADFDVYGAKAQDPANAEVKTYLSVN